MSVDVYCTFVDGITFVGNVCCPSCCCTELPIRCQCPYVFRLYFSLLLTIHKRAAVWCNPDPCGVVCACITYWLVLYAQYAVTVGLIKPWMGFSFFGVMHAVAFNVLACLAHVSHARAMLTDPGAVSCRAEVGLSSVVL